MEKNPKFADALAQYSAERNVDKFRQAMEAVKQHIDILSHLSTRSAEQEENLRTLRDDLKLYQDYFRREIGGDGVPSAPTVGSTPPPQPSDHLGPKSDPFQLVQKPSVFQLYGKAVVQSAESVLDRHQLDALEKMAEYYQPPLGPHRRGAAVLPTGTGKTGLISVCPYFLAARDYPIHNVLIISPDNDNAEQMHEALASAEDPQEIFLVKVKIIDIKNPAHVLALPQVALRPKTKAWNETIKKHDIVVTNAQKFRHHVEDGDDEALPWQLLEKSTFSLVLVDEAHHFPSGFWIRVTNHFNQCPIIFFTATPFRADKQLVVSKEEIFFTLTKQEAVNRHVIREVTFESEDQFLPVEKESPGMSAPDLLALRRSAVHKVRVDVVKKTIEALRHRDAMFPLPAQRKHCALINAYRSTDAEVIKGLFEEHGLSCETYYSPMADYEKKRIKDAFKSGEIRVLVIIRMLLEGYDNNAISVVATLSRIHSPVKFDQFIGRAVRTLRRDEPPGLKALVLIHPYFKQRRNIRLYKSEALIPTKGVDALQDKEMEPEDEHLPDVEDDAEREPELPQDDFLLSDGLEAPNAGAPPPPSHPPPATDGERKRKLAPSLEDRTPSEVKRPRQDGTPQPPQ